MKKQRPFLVYILYILLFLLGLGGIFGGAMLVADPSGRLIGMDINYLHSAPFKDYLFPGCILFVFNGLFPLFILYALLRNPSWQWPEAINIYKDQYWPWTFSLYAGIILAIWINIQLLMIGYLGSIQAWYGLWGIAIIIVTLSPAVKKYYAGNFNSLSR